MTTMNRYEPLGTGSDDQALALTIYSGKIAEAPRQSVLLWDSGLPVIWRKNVSGAKSHQFLMEADAADAEEFVPGDVMLGQAGAVDAGTISVDKYLVEHTFVPQDQMEIAHWDIMTRLALKHKRKIEQRYDRRVFTLACLAARAASVTKNGLTVHNGGNVVRRSGTAAISTAYAASSTGAANLLADLRELAYQMDLDSLSSEARYMWLSPYLRQVLQFEESSGISKVFSEEYADGENKLQQRKIALVAGFKIVGFPNQTSNNGPLPDQNLATESLSKYNADFSIQTNTGACPAISLAAGEEGQAAVGVVTYQDIKNFVVYQQDRLGWLVGSYILCGAGQMYPYCAGSLEVKA